MDHFYTLPVIIDHQGNVKNPSSGAPSIKDEVTGLDTAGIDFASLIFL
jgi:hypothetical protein